MTDENQDGISLTSIEHPTNYKPTIIERMKWWFGKGLNHAVLVEAEVEIPLTLETLIIKLEEQAKTFDENVSGLAIVPNFKYTSELLKEAAKTLKDIKDSYDNEPLNPGLGNGERL
jgi:hypothetical protein